MARQPAYPTAEIDPVLESRAGVAASGAAPDSARPTSSTAADPTSDPSQPPQPADPTTSAFVKSVEQVLAQVAAVDQAPDSEKQRNAAAVLAAALQTGQKFETPLGTLGHEQLLQLLSSLPQAVNSNSNRSALEVAAQMALEYANAAPPLPPAHAHALSGPTTSAPPHTPGPSSTSPGGYQTSPESPDKNKDKPPQGSEEWARMRKDNHKEVERRRRGNINEGITELARIVPNGEKNKGAILQRAVQYIHQLKENEARNIEKWTLEKLLMDQAMGDLQGQLEEARKRWEQERERAERAERRLGELESREMEEVEQSLQAGTKRGVQEEDEEGGGGAEKRQRVV